MPVWVRGEERAEIVAPFPQKLAVTALGKSGATPAGGLAAEVVGFDTRRRARGGARRRGQGQDRLRQPQDDGDPGRLAIWLLRGGAAAGAVDRRPQGRGGDRHPLARHRLSPQPAYRHPDRRGGRDADPGRRPVHPRRRAAPADPEARQAGDDAADAHPAQPRHPPVGQRRRRGAAAATRTPGIVLVGGHLDSWDLGTGAIDNAAGVAITAAAAKRIMEAGRPRRTIRIVWFGAEEVGGNGGNAYRAAHKDEKIVFVSESDFGADRVWRMDPGFAAANAALADRIAAALAPLGISRGTAAGERRRRPRRLGRRPGSRRSTSSRTAPAISTITTRPTTRSTRSIPSSSGRTSPPGRRCWPWSPTRRRKSSAKAPHLNPCIFAALAHGRIMVTTAPWPGTSHTRDERHRTRRTARGGAPRRAGRLATDPLSSKAPGERNCRNQRAGKGSTC